jgi:hypothetical protein
MTEELRGENFAKNARFFDIALQINRDAARHAATKGILQKQTKETKSGRNFAKNAEFFGE